MIEPDDDRVALLGDRIELAVTDAARAEGARGRRMVVGLVAVAMAVTGGLGALALSSRTAASDEVVEGWAAPTDRETIRPEDPAVAGRPADGPDPSEDPLAAEVARGMENGSEVFVGTGPSCTRVLPGTGPTGDQARLEDGLELTCTLATPQPNPNRDGYRGALHTFVDDDRAVAGACRGIDRAGTTWRCLSGQAAVRAGYIAADLLGQHQPGPGRG